MIFSHRSIAFFLKRIALWFLKAVGGIVLIYLFLLVVGIVLLRQYTPTLPEKGVLVIDVERGWVEAPVRQPPLFDLLGLGDILPVQRPYSLLESVEAVHAAKNDSRVHGLLVIGDLGQAPVNRVGLSGLIELGDAIESFGSEKPTYAYLKNPGLPDFLLASFCADRRLSPDGDTVFPGLATEVPFFAETFKTIGVGVQVAREGSHKSAVEPYLRKQFSPEAKAQQERLTTTLWQSYLDILVENTEIDRDVLENWANRRGILAPETVAGSGFAKVTDYADFLNELTDSVGPDERVAHTFSQIDLQTYLSATKLNGATSGEAPEPENNTPARVAVAFVEGVIANDDTAAITDGERIARQIREARKADDYDALVLRVNSPGGAVYPSRVVARELERTGRQMPVFVSMGQYAASGGYWVASPADHICANPLTLTGSIGVFAVLFNLEDSTEKLGLHWERTKSSEMANLFSMTEAKSPAQMEAIENMVAKTYAEFLELVAGHRGLSQDAVENIAEGKVWTGSEAQERQLVDATGGFAALKTTIAERLQNQELAFTFLAKEPGSIMDSAFSWIQGRLPFEQAAEAGEIVRSLQRYQGPISYAPVLLRF